MNKIYDNDQNDKLFDLYKLAIEMDRFELELGWKLVQFFTILNSALITAGITLLGSNQIINKEPISFIFIVGIAFSIISILSRKNYHKHSLVASCKKTLFERELNLDKPIKGKYKSEKHSFAISTSPSFEPKEDIFNDPIGYVQKNALKRGSLPFYHAMIFVLFIGINLIGIVISLSLYDVITNFLYFIWNWIVTSLASITGMFV